jgi:hypothetical protein
VAFAAPPAVAAFRHHTAREGFEVVTLRAERDGWHVAGSCSAVEDGVAWTVTYEIELDGTWRTRRAVVAGRTAAGPRRRVLEADGAEGWTVDGVAVRELAGCPDVDLEASACTNAFPVRRLALAVGEGADAPAAYVRAEDLGVQRLQQRYVRLPGDGPGERHDYSSPEHGFRAVLAYDPDGLVGEYPGLATRVAAR